MGDCAESALSLWTTSVAAGAQSTDLINMQMLPTMLKGSSLMVHLMNGVMIDGAASNTTVTSANIMADKVRRLACALPAACTRGKSRHCEALQVLHPMQASALNSSHAALSWPCSCIAVCQHCCWAHGAGARAWFAVC